MQLLCAPLLMWRLHRRRRYASLDKNSFLTEDEKRVCAKRGKSEGAGYGPKGSPPEPSAEETSSSTEVGEASTRPFDKFNPNHDGLGRFASGAGSGVQLANARRPAAGWRGPVSPSQEQRLAQASVDAQAAVRNVRERDPNWQVPSQLYDPASIEGAISAEEAIRSAAEARLDELLRDAIPGTNPNWGVNRLGKELRDMATPS